MMMEALAHQNQKSKRRLMLKKGATKKTPIKKKLKKAASAPEARVVRSLKAWLGM
jgi:hypothetical protein